MSNATFLTNSDGSYHSTYDHTTRYIKWAAGAYNNVVKIGHGSENTQIDNYTGARDTLRDLIRDENSRLKRIIEQVNEYYYSNM